MLVAQAIFPFFLLTALLHKTSSEHFSGLFDEHFTRILDDAFANLVAGQSVLIALLHAMPKVVKLDFLSRISFFAFKFFVPDKILLYCETITVHASVIFSLS